MEEEVDQVIRLGWQRRVGDDANVGLLRVEAAEVEGVGGVVSQRLVHAEVLFQLEDRPRRETRFGLFLRLDALAHVGEDRRQHVLVLFRVVAVDDGRQLAVVAGQDDRAVGFGGAEGDEGVGQLHL